MTKSLEDGKCPETGATKALEQTGKKTKSSDYRKSLEKRKTTKTLKNKKCLKTEKITISS